MPEAGIFSYPMHACAFYFISATNKEDFTMKITFPDGSVREFNEGVSAFDVAESIGSRLRKARARRCVRAHPQRLHAQAARLCG